MKKNKSTLALIDTKQKMLNFIRKGQRAYTIVATDLYLCGLEDEAALCQARYKVLQTMEAEYKAAIKELKAKLK